MIPAAEIQTATGRELTAGVPSLPCAPCSGQSATLSGYWFGSGGACLLPLVDMNKGAEIYGTTAEEALKAGTRRALRVGRRNETGISAGDRCVRFDRV